MVFTLISYRGLYSCLDCIYEAAQLENPNVILLTFWQRWCEMQNGQLSEYFLFAKNRVIVGYLVGGGQVDKRREEKEVKQKREEI